MLSPHNKSRPRMGLATCHSHRWESNQNTVQRSILENEVSQNFRPPKPLTALITSLLFGVEQNPCCFYSVSCAHFTCHPLCPAIQVFMVSCNPPASLALSFLMVNPKRKIQSGYQKRITALAPKRRSSSPSPLSFKRGFCCRLHIVGAEWPNA